MRQFHSDLYCFFDFLDRIFFLKRFPYPLIVHSRANFLLEPNFFFSLVVLFVRMRHFDIEFFLIYLSVFFRNGFSNSLVVRSRSSFLFSQ